jgi:PKD domain
MRRLALLLLAPAFVAAAPASALADDQLRIEPEDGPPTTLMLSTLGEPDVSARPYTIPGVVAPVPVTGYSLERVLEAADIDPQRSGSLVIAGTSGRVEVSRDDATGETKFPDGPPVFYLENGDARFLLPGREAGEPAQIASGGPMTVRIAALSDLRVSAKASPRDAKLDETVSFRATVDGAEEGEGIEYSWSFGDGRSGTGRELTHRFRKPGTYAVTVEARRSGDLPAAEDTVTVEVGDAPEESGGTPDSNTGAGTGGTGTGTGGTVTPVTPSAPTTPSTPSTPYDPVDEPPQPSENPPATADDQAPDGPQQIEGIELADLAGLSSEAGRDAVDALRRDEDQADGGLPDGVWWFLAISGLLLLGGLRELRGRRRPQAA